MKILITGAAGMLGTDLVEILKDRFVLIGAGLSDGAHLGIPYCKIDLTDQKTVSALWRQEKPQLVIHLAAMTQVDLCETERQSAYQANTVAVKCVADACHSEDIPMVFISTDFVFDGKEKREYTEEDSCAPLSYYGETKRLAEEYLKSSGVKFVIFRICWLYGIHGKSFPRAILEAARKQPILKVVDDQVGRPTFTRDVCMALSELLDRDGAIFEKLSGKIYHLANTGTASWADFAAETLKAAGLLDRHVQPIGWRDLDPPRAARRPEHAVMSLAKTRAELGIELRSWQKALGEFVPELQKQLAHP